MKRFHALLFSGISLMSITLKPNKIVLNQALKDHCVRYGSSSQVSKEDLSDLFLAQDLRDARRMQIKSVSQWATGDDAELRGASCGYHAFRNGSLYALGLINRDGNRAAHKSLSSQNHANELFGTKFAPWRLEIGKMRNEQTARKVGREMVFASLNLKDEGSDKDFDLLMSCIGSMMLPVFAQPEMWEDGFHYSATKKEIYHALLERRNAMSGKNEKNRIKNLIKSGKLDRYFKDDLTLDFMIDFEGNCYRIDSPDKVLARVSQDIQGNWVQSDEMPFLVDSQRGSEGILAEEPTLLVATYGEDLGGTEQHAFASEKFMQMYALLRETKHDCVGVVLVYLPGGHSARSYTVSALEKVSSWVWSWFPAAKKETSFTKDAEDLQWGQDNGHWISLVVSRIKGDVRYYILDSCNVDRLRNERINGIIDMFDGKKELPGYDWTAQQVAQSLGTHKTKTSELNKQVYKGYTWTKIGLGTAAAGLLTYAAYSLYSEHKKKKNS